ncbi:pilin [Arenimonas sp.]|uniref:pilin n=1 Tax=Arenimonas sp. TaxID=1872635 RepID=UPI0025E7877B|nr:pilin [Arenimonas sp.]
MKSPAYIVVALVVVVLFSLVAYRVSVHFATLPAEGEPAASAAAQQADAATATEAPPLPPAQAEALDAIERSAAVRSAVEGYFADRGDWPQGLAQLGLGVPGDHAGGPVAGITVQTQGVVSISLKPHVARGGVIRLTPTPTADGGFDWQCRASNYPAATRLPTCR